MHLLLEFIDRRVLSFELVLFLFYSENLAHFPWMSRLCG